MWHKAIRKGHPMKLELTRVGLLVELANHYTTRGAPTCWQWLVKIDTCIYMYLFAFKCIIQCVCVCVCVCVWLLLFSVYILCICIYMLIYMNALRSYARVRVCISLSPPLSHAHSFYPSLSLFVCFSVCLPLSLSLCICARVCILMSSNLFVDKLGNNEEVVGEERKKERKNIF